MNVPKLNILPISTEYVETYINMETINYSYGTDVDENGDREVVDVSREYIVLVKVPRISFLNWVETLCSLQKNGVSSAHIYTKELVPYKPHSSPAWGYFDQVRNNLLSNGYKHPNDCKVRIYIYLIEDFNYFAVLRLLSHQDIVSYSTQ